MKHLSKEVSFPIAKLLKEKGYNEVTEKFYPKPKCKLFGIDEDGRYYKIINKTKLYAVGEAALLKDENAYFAPTVGEVLDWIYENHKVWIYSYPVNPLLLENENYPKIVWVVKCLSMKQVMFERFINSENGLSINHHYSPYEAYESAFQYCLNNLIEKS